jgi:hypothetical protein
MNDLEVARLRQLRSLALRVRAVALALSAKRAAAQDPLLTRGACASWRIARAVSGRLKAHPYLRYQKDTALGIIVFNGMVARWLALKSTNRLQALCEYETNLRRLARQLEDARALTWSSDLSDTFGRSQTEIRSLLTAVAGETAVVSGSKLSKLSKRLPQHELSMADGRVAALAPAIEGDWPYLAF